MLKLNNYLQKYGHHDTVLDEIEKPLLTYCHKYSLKHSESYPIEENVKPLSFYRI